MDDNRFDMLVRSLASGRNRRQLVKGLLGLGSVAVAGRSFDAEAERRPTPTPKPVKCPGKQTWNGTACVCPGGATACGSDCCPNGSATCCNNACCFGECYGDALCCPPGSVVCDGECIPGDRCPCRADQIEVDDVCLYLCTTSADCPCGYCGFGPSNGICITYGFTQPDCATNGCISGYVCYSGNCVRPCA